jgi:serine/threonine protein kinase
MDPRSPRSKRGTLAGELVAGHELMHLLAVGGMGEVYLARHLKLGMVRAVKVIHADMREHESTRERFVREAQVLARLQHNSIVQIVEFGALENGFPFLAMEYIEGSNLERLVEGRPLPLAPTLVVLEQLASALAYAHSCGVVHRDLKPSNVLVRGGDVRQVKIIDFGLALILDSDMPRLTDEKQMIGSVAYMAPEQVERIPNVTGAVDIYALAGVAYRLLSGAPPFTYSSPVRLMTARVNEDPPLLSKRCPDIPPLLDVLLERCLCRDPAKRPTGAEVNAELERISRGTAVVTPAPVTEPPPPGARRIEVVVLEGRRDTEGRGLELATKIMSLIGEIVSFLSASDPELTSLLRLESRIAEQIVLLETELDGLADELTEKQREQKRELLRTLNAQQMPLQRRMVEVVERHRRHASGRILSLFDQIDRAVDELETLHS